jgi:hypothetical protein
MNEQRIREIANQASNHAENTVEYFPDTEDGLDYPAKMMKVRDLKFAQLIVAECLRQVEEQYKPVLEDEAMMKDTHWDGYVQCGVDSYVAVREHFYGVEE